MTADVLIPTSPDEAVSAFGDGSGVTVIAGGTIVIPDITGGRIKPGRAIMLHRSGLSGVTREGATLRIGAATPIAELEGGVEPLASAASGVADREVRGQATVGGNLCARAGLAPRGDLQAPLIAMGARVRSAGAGGERTEPVEDFLANRDGRLVLELEVAEPAAAGFASLDRPHSHDYTAMAVAACRLADGSVRIAATGTGTHGIRLPSAEAKADDPDTAGQAALADVRPHDDALASAWYRERTLPVLVRRALAGLKEGS